MKIRELIAKNIWTYIKFFSLVFSIPISFVSGVVMVYIISNDSAESVSSWISSAATVASAIATIGVGYFAYRIAQKQKDSSQISVLIDVSRFFSDSINENYNKMLNASSKHVADMGFPSKYVGDYIQMGEIIKSVSSDTTAETSKIVFKSLISPMAWNELETGRLLWHFINYEFMSRRLDFVSLSDDEKKIFITIYNQYRISQSKFSNLISVDNREFWNKIEEKLRIN